MAPYRSLLTVPPREGINCGTRGMVINLPRGRNPGILRSGSGPAPGAYFTKVVTSNNALMI